MSVVKLYQIVSHKLIRLLKIISFIVDCTELSSRS